MAILLFICGCSATTITEHEGNYIYSQNEDINILDIDTRNNIGTLKMTGVELLKNQPFTIKEINGTDESGNDIYEEVTYAQLVQVSFYYDSKGSSKTISSSNFYIYDSAGTSGSTNPDIDYNAVKRSGEKYFVVALKNKSDYINLDFKYKIMQMTNTAKIKLNISAKPDSASSQRNSVSSASASSQRDSASSASASGQRDSASSASASGQRDSGSDDANPLRFYFIIGVLGAAVLALIIIVIVQSRRR